jgi:hypothetical protein
MKKRHESFQKGQLKGRKNSFRTPKKQIFIYCEGANTEPQYFADLRQFVKNSLIRIEIMGAQGAPMTIVESAIAKRKELLQIARRSSDSFDKDFVIWAIFDVDEHPRLLEAKNLAQSFQIKVGCSNPCFEIWLLYHCEDCHRPFHRHDLQKYLSSKLTSYRASHGKTVDFGELQNSVGQAIQRAKNGLVSREAAGDPEGNPTTTVSDLVALILQQ